MLKRFEKKFKTKGHIRGTLFWCIQRKTEREREIEKRRRYPTYHSSMNKPTSLKREVRFSFRNLARQIARQSSLPAPALFTSTTPSTVSVYRYEYFQVFYT
jgi:hypothetical protein